MPPLLPKHLLSTGKKEAAGILAFGAIHTGLLILVVFWGEESSCYTFENPFLFCQLGLLAWWACLKGPRRFWRIVLSVALAASLFALASREYILAASQPSQGWSWLSLFWDAEPWDEWGWGFYFISTGGLLPVTAPFIFLALVILGWVVPCTMTRRHGRPDAPAAGPPDRALNAWQFGIGDLLALTVAIAAVTGLVAWVQPYPTWILECEYNAVVYAGTKGEIITIVTITLGTWFSGYFLLGQTIRPRHLAILVLLGAINIVLSVLSNDVLGLMSLGTRELTLKLWYVKEAAKWTLICWIILGSSFYLLRIAGFRITRARSRLLRRWSLGNTVGFAE